VLQTNVYIDGFNLYYGCLKGTPYKWLDLDALCRSAAGVSPSAGDHAARLRPPGAFPDVPRADAARRSASRGPRTVEVIRTEKGSDVNLATYLLADAFRRDCEAAVVIRCVANWGLRWGWSTPVIRASGAEPCST
jgi:hypothetical protein